MKTRRAAVTDVQGILDLLETYHLEQSNLKDILFDRTSMLQVVQYYMTTPKHIVFVVEDDTAAVCGVLLGSIEPFIFNQHRQWATDTVFVANKGGAWLLRRFLKWAKQYRVDRIVMGISSGNARVGKLYERENLQNVGGMYIWTAPTGETQ